jgi:BlaI family transcriptional regulator, penicillinase repressor
MPPCDDASLTPLEFEIMAALWDLAPAGVREVREHPAVAARCLAYNTVQTVLNILVRKGKARRMKRGRAFEYEALLSRSQVSGAAVRDLVDRLFEGNAERLVLSLVRTRRLKPEKLAELKALVEEESHDRD